MPFFSSRLMVSLLNFSSPGLPGYVHKLGKADLTKIVLI
jgi:hypothetical protein